MVSMTTLPLSLPDLDVSCKEATAAFIKKSSVVLWFVKASECQQLIPGLSSFCWEAMRKKSFSCLGVQKELELLEQELWKACVLFHLTNEISLVCTGELDSFHHRNLLEGGRYHEILNTVIFTT